MQAGEAEHRDSRQRAVQALARREAALIVDSTRGVSYADLARAANQTETVIKNRVRRLLALGLVPRRKAPAAPHSAVAGEARMASSAVNAWPDGPREIVCLCCPAQFVSTGKDDRQCPRCSSRSDHPFVPNTGGGRRKLARR